MPLRGAFKDEKAPLPRTGDDVGEADIRAAQRLGRGLVNNLGAGLHDGYPCLTAGVTKETANGQDADVRTICRDPV